MHEVAQLFNQIKPLTNQYNKFSRATVIQLVINFLEMRQTQPQNEVSKKLFTNKILNKNQSTTFALSGGHQIDPLIRRTQSQAFLEHLLQRNKYSILKEVINLFQISTYFFKSEQLPLVTQFQFRSFYFCILN